MVVAYLCGYDKAVFSTDHHGSVQLRCTSEDSPHFTTFPLVASDEMKAAVSLGSGRLLLRTSNGDRRIFDVADAMWSNMFHMFWPICTPNLGRPTLILSREQFVGSRPWLALPWQSSDVRINVSRMGPVSIIFVFDHLIPQHIRDGDFRPFVRCHGEIRLFMGGLLPHFFDRLVLGLRFFPAEDRWRKRAISVLLALNARVGQNSLIQVLRVDLLRRIMEMEYSMTSQASISNSETGGSSPNA
jgi:hypothetical protein